LNKKYMTKDELKMKIANADSINSIEKIADEIMAIPIPWFFTDQFPHNAIQKFADFKLYMAQKFKIPATDVFICGSALLGFSLSPKKDFANFNDKSDIDIVIISKKMFDRFWETYFADYVYSRLNRFSYTNTAKTVFKRFIDFHSQYAQNTKVYREWEKQTSGYQKDLQIIFNFPENVSYRIYRSYNDYKQNLVKNIYDIKNPYSAEVQ